MIGRTFWVGFITLALACTFVHAQTTPANSPAAAAPSTLEAQIATLLADSAVARDHWGIDVTALDGTPIYSLNEAQLFQPASNAKLFTTTAAMALLGPDHTFTTRISGALDPANGHITGDLTLIGGGDANFDSRDLPYIAPANRPKNIPHQPNPLPDLNDLVTQLVAKGVKAVDGDIVGDDTLFPWQPYPADWSIDDAVWGYGAPVSALTIADNQLRLTMRAGTAPGTPGSILLEQAVPYYTIEGGIQTVATKAEATGVQVERTPGSHVLRIYGSMAVKDETDIEEVAIYDPAEYAAMALKASLVAHGITVKGSPHAHHREVIDGSGFLTALRRPGAEDRYIDGENMASDCLEEPPDPGVTTLATYASSSLQDNVIFTNKVSQNLHAELLLHHLGSAGMLCGRGSTVEGARMVRAFLLHAGIEPNDFVFFDGSGLSGHDLVTPRATARLLAFAASNPPRIGLGSPQPWFAAWRASLPIGGEDGSLASRFPNPPLKDHVFAKTGTLGEARALSGYLDCASGRTVIFSIMVGNHLPGTSADLAAMDKIVAAIAAAE
jgi:D-alanyl-D-alanine carboxypeptidase/D-alanyl-D-alanine-endopeptidase (penicillin-binding protein 4)